MQEGLQSHSEEDQKFTIPRGNMQNTFPTSESLKLEGDALVDELYEQHLEDYNGMIEDGFTKEKSAFVAHINSELIKSSNPAVAEAAKKFLIAIGRYNEN